MPPLVQPTECAELMTTYADAEYAERIRNLEQKEAASREVVLKAIRYSNLLWLLISERLLEDKGGHLQGTSSRLLRQQNRAAYASGLLLHRLPLARHG